jgi:accessory gene regulator B
MEKFSKSVAAKLADELEYDNDKREVMAYGAFALTQMFISVGLVMIFGFMFHVVIEALIISFAASILRKYSGGVHASSPNTCTFLGIVVCVGFALLIKLVFAPLTDIKEFLIVGVGVFVWSIYTVNKLAPVDTPNKPIRSEAKRNRMRKGSLAVIGMYFLIACANLFVYLYFGWDAFFVYSICLTFGVFWQVFTLTGIGHWVIERLDLILHIFNINKEENYHEKNV